jgi:hypothetical protein
VAGALLIPVNPLVHSGDTENVLVSVIIVNICIPLWTARERTTRRSLHKTILFMLLFNSVYALGLRYAYWLA